MWINRNKFLSKVNNITTTTIYSSTDNEGVRRYNLERQ